MMYLLHSLISCKKKVNSNRMGGKKGLVEFFFSSNCIIQKERGKKKS